MLNPPTDNLYKFMAIIGLILWVGGALYPFTKAYEVEKELITLEAEFQHIIEVVSTLRPNIPNLEDEELVGR